MKNSNAIKEAVHARQPTVFTKRDIKKALPHYFGSGGSALGYYRSVIKGQVLIEWCDKWGTEELVMLKTLNGSIICKGLELPKSAIDEATLFALARALTVQDIIDAEATNSHGAAARLLVEKACLHYGKRVEFALCRAVGMEPIECFKMVMKQRRVATEGVAA